MILLCTAQLVLLLDFSIVNLALPGIIHSLGFTERSVQWVVSAYALSFGGILLLGGQLCDRYSRRLMLVVGLSIFGVASLIAALAPVPGLLVAMRAIQGIGAAVIAPAILSILNSHFPEGAQRNRALGFFGAAGASGFAVGVLLGGVLVQAFGWRAVLLVNVPITGVLITATFGVLKADRQRAAHRGLNVVDVLLSSAALSSLLFGLTEIPQDGAGSVTAAVPMAAGLVLLAWFGFRQVTGAHPLLPHGLLRLKELAVANGLNLLVPGMVGAGVLLISIQLQTVVGDSPLDAGLSLLPLGLVVVIAAPVSAVLTSKFGAKWVLAAGTAVAAAGLGCCAAIGRSSSYAGLILPGLLLTGIGFAAYTATTTIAGTSAVTESQQGVASGLLNATIQLGTAIGVAALTTLAAGARNIQNTDYRFAMTLGAVVVLASSVIAAVSFPRRPRRQAVSVAQGTESSSLSSENR